MKCRFFILLLFIFGVHVGFSQNVIYQDVCHCGVTGSGFSTGKGFGLGNFSIYIEPGSSIKKAYLFTLRIGFPPNVNFILNGNSISFNILNYFSQFNYSDSFASPMRVYYKDITSLISPNITNYNVTIPTQSGLPINWGYWTIYLYVIYENPNLPTTASVIIVNNQKLEGNEMYNVINLLPIETSYPVGFAIYTDRIGFGGGLQSSRVSINGNNIGMVNASDSNSSLFDASGVKGSFYYQNNTLYGLMDDTPNQYVDSNDGLADIRTYLPNNATNFSFKLKDYWNNNPYLPPGSANLKMGYFLTYSTPCAPIPATVSPDTTICYGKTVQLHASGGTKYEWSLTTLSPHNPQTSGNPAPGLSCSNCPNPTFTGDSSQVYTVRIWSNDSCSVVRPVRVTVRHLQQPKVTAKKTLCGTKNGRIQVGNLPSKAKIWGISSLGDTITPTNSNTFTQLPAGEYTVFYTDTFGCKSPDTIVTVGSKNNTFAAFDTHPDNGKVPLQVDIQNQSQNANHFLWSVNGVLKPSPFIGFLADTAGNYQIRLLAWQYDKSCADTAFQTVVVKDRIWIKINTLLTPNNDHKNDTWFIENIQNYPNNKVTIFNRWGNVVFQKTGYKNKWDGTANRGATVGDGKLPNGTYFYVVTVKNEGNSKVFKGYLELER